MRLLIAFAVLWIVFRILEAFRPKAKRLPILRRGLFTDMVYWAFTPVVTRAVTAVAVAIVAAPIAKAIYGKVDRDLIMHGYGPLSQLPIAVHAAGILILGDFMGYWGHRAFHRGRLWRFHAIHHSSVQLDWLSAVRLHPVNDALMRILTTVPILIAGFAPATLSAVIPILIFYSILLHANVDWDFGPLRSLIASPRFHRWHHTGETEARDKNFAGLLPLWDILFGTYYMPKGKVPERFGTETPVPSGLLGQLVFPFRRS